MDAVGEDRGPCRWGIPPWRIGPHRGAMGDDVAAIGALWGVAHRSRRTRTQPVGRQRTGLSSSSQGMLPCARRMSRPSWVVR